VVDLFEYFGYTVRTVTKGAHNMLVSELVAQLQALPQHLPVTAFSHYNASELELHNAELSEEFGEAGDEDYVEESVTLHFDV
jgi:hypothetical protein